MCLISVEFTSPGTDYAILVSEFELRTWTWRERHQEIQQTDHRGDYNCTVRISLTFSPRKEFASYPNGNHCKLAPQLQSVYLLLPVIMSSYIVLPKQRITSNTLVLAWESKTSWNLYVPICPPHLFLMCLWMYTVSTVYFKERHSYLKLDRWLKYLVISKG